MRDTRAVETCLEPDQRTLILSHALTKDFPFDFHCQVEVMTTPLGFAHRLMVYRPGLRDKFEQDDAMPVNAGIHPYFRLTKEGGVVSVGENVQWLGKPFGAIRWPMPNLNAEVEIKLWGVGRVIMKLYGYGALILWSDSDKYACVEPVLYLPPDFASSKGKWLTKGEALEAYCNFSFTPET